MATQSTPSDPRQAQDPSMNYERSHPDREAGLGKLHNEAAGATPTDHPDKMSTAVTQAQNPKQLNADDVVDGNGSRSRDPSRTEAANQPAVGDVRPQSPPGRDFQATGPR